MEALSDPLPCYNRCGISSSPRDLLGVSTSTLISASGLGYSQVMMGSCPLLSYGHLSGVPVVSVDSVCILGVPLGSPASCAAYVKDKLFSALSPPSNASPISMNVSLPSS